MNILLRLGQFDFCLTFLLNAMLYQYTGGFSRSKHTNFLKNDLLTSCGPDFVPLDDWWFDKSQVEEGIAQPSPSIT